MHGTAKLAWLSPKPDVSGGGFVRSRAGGARITLLPLYVENATQWNPGSPEVDPGRSPARLQCVDESQANPVVLNPGNSAFAMTRRKRWGTNAGFSTSMAAPSTEIFRTMQPMTEPPDDT